MDLLLGPTSVFWILRMGCVMLYLLTPPRVLLTAAACPGSRRVNTPSMCWLYGGHVYPDDLGPGQRSQTVTLAVLPFTQTPPWSGIGCWLYSPVYIRYIGRNSREFEFEWGLYALSASKAIFRVRTYSHITYSVR